MMVFWWLAACLPLVLGCELSPGPGAAPKSPGDNFYRLIVNGDVERYAPNQRYVVTLVGSRTHNMVQQFTRFKLVTEPMDPGAARSISRQGQFQLFADTLSRFDDACTNTVVEADDLPKTEVQVMWKAPPTGSGCVLLKAMVFENASRWFAEDAQLTKRVCEDMSLSAPDCCACDDAKYKVVFQGLWSAQTHPKDFPTQVAWLTHFSDLIGATHHKNFSFWGEGKIASDGFKSLAEWGSTGLLERELLQSRRQLRTIVKAQGLWHPKVNTNTTTTFTVDRKRHLLSLVSMFGPSPDWVVGVSGLELCRQDCSWEESQVLDLLPYDAGTDNGISYMSQNAETIPREKMYRITTMYPEDPRAPFYSPQAHDIPPLARLYITREKLISKSCDEETLKAMVADEENTLVENRPECATGEWSAWSACSVSCGKGLRMRRRQLLASDASATCAVQLVGKEMCVASVPECPASDNTEEEEAPADVAPVESGVCGTTAWGAWSACSVTCGVGLSTRRRRFLDRMGFKKCPLVPTEESRKCMVPVACSEETAPEEQDPACPTTAWSGWSACSASCGRGVSFRTRLLLVPADRQEGCGARVQLMQHQPCQDRDSCLLDMATAKRICMEEADEGPCRGVYPRWTFMAQKGMCVPFSYGGCRGNQNNFLKQEDCTNTCSVILGVAPAAAARQQNPAGGATPGAAGGNEGAGASVDCQLGPWSDWSKCSVTCGRGVQERSRDILSEAGPGGESCSEKVLRRKRRCLRPC